jgi:hypothetical protein
MLTPAPRETTPRNVGTGGEVVVGQRLDGWAASGGGYVLHDRRIPGSRACIDHIAIGASGVWVIDAQCHAGRVEHVDRGSWSRPDWRLTVGGRNRSKLADGVLKQRDLVATVLHGAPGGNARPEVHGMLCLFTADFQLWPRPFEHAAVHVGWPLAMVQLLNQAGPAGPRAWKAAAATLARRFPSA